MRYGDDLLVAAETRERAEEALARLSELLHQRHLTLHAEKTAVEHFHAGIRYLGVSLGPDPEPAGAAPAEEAATSFSAIPRTLYVCQACHVLRRRKHRFVVTQEDRELLSVSPHRVGQILMMGNCPITLPAMRLAASRRIPVFLLTATGKYVGYLHSGGQGNLELQRRQWVRSLDPDFAQRIAVPLVCGKLHNAQALLRQKGVQGPASEDIQGALARLDRLRERAEATRQPAELLGVEGAAAATYFQA